MLYFIYIFKYQHHIIDTIGSIDDLIENNNKIIFNLEQIIWLDYLKFKSIIDYQEYIEIPIKESVEIKTGKKNANAAKENGKYAFFTCSLDNYKTNDFAFDCQAIIIAGNGAINVKYYKGKFDAYQRTYVITTNKYFFYHYFIYKDNINNLISSSKGSVINFITLGMLQEIKVKYSNEKNHKEFEEKCNQIMNKITQLQSHNEYLNKLKNIHLKKYFG